MYFSILEAAEEVGCFIISMLYLLVVSFFTGFGRLLVGVAGSSR